MEELGRRAGNSACAANQVYYSLSAIKRGAGHALLLPGCSATGPDGSRLIDQGVLAANARLAELAARRARARQLALAWAMQQGGVMAIQAVAQAHLREKLRGGGITLAPGDLAALDAIFRRRAARRRWRWCDRAASFSQRVHAGQPADQPPSGYSAPSGAPARRRTPGTGRCGGACGSPEAALPTPAARARAARWLRRAPGEGGGARRLRRGSSGSFKLWSSPGRGAGRASWVHHNMGHLLQLTLQGALVFPCRAKWLGRVRSWRGEWAGAPVDCRHCGSSTLISATRSPRVGGHAGRNSTNGLRLASWAVGADVPMAAVGLAGPGCARRNAKPGTATPLPMPGGRRAVFIRAFGAAPSSGVMDESCRRAKRGCRDLRA